MDIRSLLEVCEQELRSGQGQRVATRMAHFELSQIPRELKLNFANICRRAGLTTVGLKILGSVVRSETDQASDREKAEYAVLLQRQGATREALRLLQTVDKNSAPEALLYQAFCHFNLWEYAKALEPLHQYLQSSQLTPYQRLVGNVNLAAALLGADELAQAETHLLQCLFAAREVSAIRLEVNCLEMLAQIRTRKGDLAYARKALRDAELRIGPENTTDRFFVQKWTAVADAMESKSTVPLRSFQDEARRLGDWESVREADLFVLKIKFDERAFANLYFGTPFPAYRQKILRELGQPIPQGRLLVGEPEAENYLDLETGESTLPRSLNAGKKIHQVLTVLTRDLYRPMRTGELFSELYPEEYYNPQTSPGRVFQVLQRARKFLQQAGIPAHLRQRNGYYDIVLTDRFVFRGGFHTTDNKQVLWSKISSLFKSRQAFSSEAACKALDLSPSSFRRFAKWALDQGLLVRFGAGSGTSYRLNLSYLQPKM